MSGRSFAVFAVLIGALAAVGVSMRWWATSRPAAASIPATVPTVITGSHRFAQSAQFTGTALRRAETSFFSESVANEVAVAVRFGETVERGQLLLELRSDDLNGEIDRLRAEIALNRQWLDEQFRLARDRLVHDQAEATRHSAARVAEARALATVYDAAGSEGRVDASAVARTHSEVEKATDDERREQDQFRLELARLEADRLSREAANRSSRQFLEIASRSRDRLRVVAPYSGHVTGLSASLAAPIAKGTYLLTVSDLAPRFVQLAVNANEVQAFIEKRAVACRPKRQSASVGCRVATAQPTADGRHVILRLELEPVPPELTEGDAVDVNVALRDVLAEISVPRVAIRWQAGTQGVNVRRDGRFVFQPVDIGAEDGTHAEVLRGLEAGDEVALD